MIAYKYLKDHSRHYILKGQCYSILFIDLTDGPHIHNYLFLGCVRKNLKSIDCVQHTSHLMYIILDLPLLPCEVRYNLPFTDLKT